MKRLIPAALILSLTLSLCACSHKPDKDTVTMKVRTFYGGYSIAGEDLGHGEFTNEIKGLKEGDCIYESFDGTLKTEFRDEDAWMLKIESIGEDSLEIKIAEVGYRDDDTRGSYSCSMKYGTEKHFDSMFVVYDGMNYDYLVSFTK